MPFYMPLLTYHQNNFIEKKISIYMLQNDITWNSDTFVR